MISIITHAAISTTADAFHERGQVLRPTILDRVSLDATRQ